MIQQYCCRETEFVDLLNIYISKLISSIIATNIETYNISLLNCAALAFMFDADVKVYYPNGLNTAELVYKFCYAKDPKFFFNFMCVGNAYFIPLFTFKTYQMSRLFNCNDDFEFEHFKTGDSEFYFDIEGSKCSNCSIKKPRNKKLKVSHSQCDSSMLQGVAPLNVDVKCISFTEEEKIVVNSIRHKSFKYCLLKYIQEIHVQDLILPTFFDLLEFQKPSTTDSSKIDYLYILDENADSRDTIRNILYKLYHEMGIHKRINYLVIVGDGKTYDHLISIKNELGNELEWLLPYPGDWHILKNFQGTIMKIYFDAGLKELVELFHHGILAKVVSQATSFDKTHQFLVQVWEAFYRFEIQYFIKNFDENLNDLNLDTDAMILNIQSIFDIVSKHLDKVDSTSKIIQVFDDLIDKNSVLEDKFIKFYDHLCEKSKTWQFWHNFVHRDCIAYISLYTSLRHGNWTLRNYSIKYISRLSQVTGATYYNRLLPQSLIDLQTISRLCN